MKLIDGDNLIEHAEVNCESADFVEKLIDYVSEQEEVSISQDQGKDLISRRKALDLAKDIIVPTKDGGVYRHRCIDPDEIRELPSAQPELTENWWKTDHGYMWLCPHCGLPVHSDFEECLRCGIKRPSAQPIINVTLDEDKVARVVEHQRKMQERKKGKWIVKSDGIIFKRKWGVCSECGNILDFNGVNAGRGDANYCPNCGAKMER